MLPDPAFRPGACLAFLLVVMSAQAGAGPAVAPPAGSLYARLGGAASVEAIARELIETAAHDPRTRRSFERVNLARVEGLLAEQICALTGGGCTYTGDDMREVHAGHGIRTAEFNAMVEQLRAILHGRGIALRERNELLALLAPMKRAVVDPPR